MDTKLIVSIGFVALGCSHRGDTPEATDARRTTPTTVVATRGHDQYVFESPAEASPRTKRAANPATAPKQGQAPSSGETRAKSYFATPGTHLDDSGNTVTIPPSESASEAESTVDASPTALDQGENERDITLTTQIRRALMGDQSLSFDAKNVAVVSKDGNVTLRGVVKSASERSTIDNFARRIAGERAVDNRIEVKP